MSNRFDDRRVDMQIYQGETYQHEFFYVDSNNAAIPLTSYTARMQIREYVEDTSTVYSATDADDISIDEPGGKVTVTIPATDTAGWTFDRAYYDLELVSPTSEVDKLAWGTITLKDEVTR